MRRSIFKMFAILFLINLFIRSLLAQDNLTEQENGWLARANRYEKNGWVVVHIEGEPFERGFQCGYLTAQEIDDFLKTLAYIEKFETGRDWEFFVRAADSLFSGKIESEYYMEMKGIVSGMNKAGKKITYEEILLLNTFLDIFGYWYPHEKGKFSEPLAGCSAFVATGESTADGKIVLGHNSWSGFEILKYANIILDIQPSKGHRIFMQSWGASLYSATDFFITGAGIVGCETTIGGFSEFDSRGTPVFQRARKAMQYASTIDEWAKIMIEGNNGAYANSWLLGDINRNEIAQFELGLKYHSLLKKTSGYFVGSNVADNLKILRLETGASYDDIRMHSVARRVRWQQLMKEYKGKIDAEIGKRMLGDHYDTYLNREQPSGRTICGHLEVEDGKIPGFTPFRPSGAMDGKVVSAEMARQFQFWAKWGASCDRIFKADEFLTQHPQYEWMRGYLPDISAYPWTVFTAQ